MITVLIPQPLRTLTNGESVLTAEGHNLRAVIRDLAPRYPELAERLVNEGRIGRGLSLAINGDVVSTGLITKVPEGAEIAIVPQISGGSGCSVGSAEEDCQLNKENKHEFLRLRRIGRQQDARMASRLRVVRDSNGSRYRRSRWQRRVIPHSEQQRDRSLVVPIQDRLYNVPHSNTILCAGAGHRCPG